MQFTSSDSLGALISMCPSKEEQRNEKNGGGGGRVYSKEFQAMLDSLESEDCAEESGLGSEKKRRLSSDQVRALEKYFEVENKLEPDRKVKLAEELGLQPRQVAIWFQNRRARWKTKQLERDFGVLKANYDSLKLKFNALQQEKDALSAELRELKAKLARQNASDSQSPAMPDSVDNNNVSSEQSKFNDLCDNGGEKVYGDFKDNGSSDSDSNGIFKDESDVNNARAAAAAAQLQLLSPPPLPAGAGYHNFAGSSSSSSQQQQPVMNWFQLPDLRMIPGRATAQQQLVKMEEQSMFSSEESCNIYSVDQAPTLHWYFPDP